jgi:hypothetical protein
MMKFNISAVKKWSLVTLAGAVLGGCNEVKIENGEIPQEAISSATPYLGEYPGSFDGRAGTLELKLDGRKALLNFRSTTGGELLPGCHAMIGNLEAISVRTKDSHYILKNAKFAFDPNLCWSNIKGRQLIVEFSERRGRQSVGLYLHKESQIERKCRWDPGMPDGRTPPRHTCQNVEVRTYLEGQFTR